MVRASVSSAPRAIASSCMPKTPIANSVDTKTIRQARNPERIGSPAGRGARRITSGSGGSKASAIASATELTMFTHNICTGVIGRATPARIAAIRHIDSPPLTGSRNMMAFLRLSYTARPARTASAMVAKLSSASTISAASFAASLPLPPIAMPTSARFRAGASLTPSPVIATTAPSACRACTRRSLCSGLVRAKTSDDITRCRSVTSSSRSMSAPVTTSKAPGRPRRRAIADAVPAWSPVIIFTRMPAAWQSATAAIASSRGGSISPKRPSSVRPLPTSSNDSVDVPTGTSSVATAITR